MSDGAAPFPVVDAHVHFWDLAQLRYDWLTPPFAAGGPNGDVSAIARTYRPADYRAETARWRPAGAVHVEAGAAAHQGLDETRWLGRLAADDGLPDGIVAHVDLAAPDAAARIAAQAAEPRVRGVRQIVNWHPDPDRTYGPRDLTLEPGWARGLAAVAAAGLSFDLQCYPAQMPRVAALLAPHEAMGVMVNHLGMPVLTDAEGLAEWRAGLAALAALPQVAIKLSGMGFVRRDWDEGLVRPLILTAIDLFGAGRVMIATDLPTDRLFGTVDRHLWTYDAVTADLSADERRALWGGNADRLYRLGLGVGTGARGRRASGDTSRA